MDYDISKYDFFCKNDSHLGIHFARALRDEVDLALIICNALYFPTTAVSIQDGYEFGFMEYLVL